MAGVILHHPQGDEPCLTQTGDGCIDGFHQWKNPPIRRKPSRNPPVENWVENSVTLLQTNIDVEKPPFKLIILQTRKSWVFMGFPHPWVFLLQGISPYWRYPQHPRPTASASLPIHESSSWRYFGSRTFAVAFVSWMYTSMYIHWIGLREILQETMVFTIKYRAFL